MDKPVIAIVGAHNSGKTTFIEKVVNILSEEGFNVCYIKHDPKGKAKTDTEGKDSYKVYQAGAKQVIVASPDKVSSFVRLQDYTLFDFIKNFTTQSVDIIIVEGFKTVKGIDKFEVIRKEENRQLMINKEDGLIGVITDYYQYETVFDINNPQEFVIFLKNNYLKR
ncbi:molybdopterin-guanine dinucleotide biosynthesis protein B [Sulfurihydrogenibium subterraneum]|uniref:molybdopterin-guanine dinucleotide biosynthesis protein B n=1 Tax=Sulfurihydrogenibium subterraneum TaxID=171121 RepID=UPI000490D5E2|nr:molybdopterin-guanine dinucleotide biosynthesis protein B [Sulfurihydrogenibium subterraneum]